MNRVRGAGIAAVLAVAVAAGPAGPETPEGGFRSRTCMEAVYESLGIWAFRPYAVALVWGMTCAVWGG